MKSNKSKRHFDQVKRFEELLPENSQLQWQTECNRFTLYGYFVRGEIVINQVMHDGGGSWQFTMVKGDTWDSIKQAIDKIAAVQA